MNVANKGCRECGISLRKQNWFDGLYFYPSTLINAEGFGALARRFAGDVILLYHLAPEAERYEGIDGRCHDRSPSRILCGLLSGVLAACLGLRISYRLIVKGDDRTDFHGLITWKFLVPFSSQRLAASFL